MPITLPNSSYTFKSKSNILMICILLIIGVCCGLFAYFLWPSKTLVSGVSLKTGDIIVLIFAGFSSIFSILSIYTIITFRSYSLTNTELIIGRPLFFSKNKILLTDIAGFSEKDVMISLSRGISFEDFSIGHKTIVRFKNGEQTIISSLEIWNYRLFIKQIKSAVRSKS